MKFELTRNKPNSLWFFSKEELQLSDKPVKACVWVWHYKQKKEEAKITRELNKKLGLTQKPQFWEVIYFYVYDKDSNGDRKRGMNGFHLGTPTIIKFASIDHKKEAMERAKEIMRTASLKDLYKLPNAQGVIKQITA